MDEKPRAKDDGTYCPLWRKPCSKVCHACAWWTHVRGKHPQTNEDVDKWACAMAIMPILSIENTQAQRQTTSTVQGLRNDAAASRNAGLIETIEKANAALLDEGNRKRIADGGARALE